MRKIFIVVFACFIPAFFFGQTVKNSQQIKRNTIYFEAFGQGLYNSLSFDRLYRVENKVKTSFSAGLTIIPHRELFVLGAPISYNYIFGQKGHHFELGIGFTAMYMRHGSISASENFIDDHGIERTNNFVGRSNDFYSFFTPKIGYRFQKPSGGIFLRFSLTPPVAGINKIGSVKGGSHQETWPSYTEYFSSAAFFGYRVFPWAGISLGWTLKR